MRLQVPPEYASNPDVRKWIELHGVRLQNLDGGVFAFLQTPCSALTEEGMCGVYGTDARPDLCSHFPATPAALTGVEDVCTYSFKEPSYATA
jgi:Fe-S-cluster containining protein